MLSIFTWLVLYISHELYAAVIFILYLGFFFSFIYNTIEDEYKLSLKKIKIGAITTTIAYVSFMAIFLDLENSLYLFILSLIPAFFVIITLYYEQKHVNMDPEEKFGTDEGYKWSLGIESLFGIILVLLIMIMSLGSYTVDILEGQDQTKTFQRDNISFTYPSEWFEEYNPEGFYFIFESVDGGAFGMEILINNHEYTLNEEVNRIKKYHSNSYTIVNSTNISVNDVPAVQLYFNNSYTDERYHSFNKVVFIKHRYIYVITFTGEDVSSINEDMVMVLKSFKTSLY